MSRHLKSIAALALVFCLLLPAVALPRMYAPNDPRNGLLEGHPEPPTKVAAKTRTLQIDDDYVVIVFFLGQSIVFSKSRFGTLLAWL